VFAPIKPSSGISVQSKSLPSLTLARLRQLRSPRLRSQRRRGALRLAGWLLLGAFSSVRGLKLPPTCRVTQSALNALDFAAPRSKKDAELLYDAKYGARGEDGKMTREQYAALRRKVGGTAKDYWKDWIAVDVQEPTGVTTSTGEVPFLPVLIAVLLAVLGTTAYISMI
jgi:hypothetical protein